MNKDKFMEICPLCENEYQFGPEVYKGRKLAGYNLFVCDMCYNMNWDGWQRRLEGILIEHLNKSGIPLPKRNKNGLLPREF